MWARVKLKLSDKQNSCWNQLPFCPFYHTLCLLPFSSQSLSLSINHSLISPFLHEEIKWQNTWVLRDTLQAQIDQFFIMTRIHGYQGKWYGCPVLQYMNLKVFYWGDTGQIGICSSDHLKEIVFHKEKPNTYTKLIGELSF